MKRYSVALRASLIAILLALPGCGDREGDLGSLAPQTGVTLAPHRMAPDFSLTDQHGTVFRLSEQVGKPTLLFFGYIHCPDVCPTTLSTWSRVERELGPQAADVTFAFITVDPERDTAQQMAKHMSVFSTRFRGLRGSAEELNRVYEAYNISHDRVPIPGSAAGYVIDHSSRMFLIARDGLLSKSVDFRVDPESLLFDLRRMLAEEDR